MQTHSTKSHFPILLHVSKRSCLILFCSTAEFKGPGVHHGGNNHASDDSGDDYDMDLDQRTRMIGGRAGRIILLGDGTEVLTDSSGIEQDEDDTDMFDQSSDDEEKDLESQVRKGQSEANDADGSKGSSTRRNEREETPGPDCAVPIQAGHDITPQAKAEKSAGEGTGPGSTPAEPKMMAATDGVAKED